MKIDGSKSEWSSLETESLIEKGSSSQVRIGPTRPRWRGGEAGPDRPPLCEKGERPGPRAIAPAIRRERRGQAGSTRRERNSDMIAFRILLP